MCSACVISIIFSVEDSKVCLLEMEKEEKERDSPGFVH